MKTSALKEGEIYTNILISQLDFTTAQEVFEQGQRAINTTHNYSEATKHFIRALDTVQSDISSTILLHPAHSYELQKKIPTSS